MACNLSNFLSQYIILKAIASEEPSIRPFAALVMTDVNNDVKNEEEELNNSMIAAFKKQQTLVNETYDKFVVAARPLLSFLIGAVIGAKTMDVGTFWSYSIPLSIILLFIIELLIKEIDSARLS